MEYNKRWDEKQHVTACNIPVNAILWLGLCTLCMIQHCTNGQRTCISIQVTYTMILELWKCFLSHFQCPLQYTSSCNHYFLTHYCLFYITIRIMILLLYMRCCSIFCPSESKAMLFQMFQYRLNNHDCHFHVVSYQVLNTVYLQQTVISLETLDVSVEKPYMWIYNLTPTLYGHASLFCNKLFRCYHSFILSHDMQYASSYPIKTYSRVFSDPTKAHVLSQITLRKPESQYSLHKILYNIQFHHFCKWWYPRKVVVKTHYT